MRVHSVLLPVVLVLIGTNAGEPIAASDAFTEAALSNLGVASIGLMTDAKCLDSDSSCLNADQHTMKDGTDFPLTFNHSCAEPATHYGPACSSAYAPAEVLSAPVERLAAMIQRQDSNVEWNPGRHAIQVIGCSGGVVLHVSLTTEAEAELAALVS